MSEQNMDVKFIIFLNNSCDPMMNDLDFINILEFFLKKHKRKKKKNFKM